MKSCLYVCEAKSLTSFVALLQCDNFQQAEKAIRKMKSFDSKTVYTMVTTQNKYPEVTAHFNDYIWD